VNKQDPNVDNSHIAIGCMVSEILSAEVSRCKRQLRALPVTRAAWQWLHLTHKVWLPISVL